MKRETLNNAARWVWRAIVSGGGVYAWWLYMQAPAAWMSHSAQQGTLPQETVSWVVSVVAFFVYVFGGAALCVIPFGMVMCSCIHGADSWRSEIDRVGALLGCLITAAVILTCTGVDMAFSTYPGGLVGYTVYGWYVYACGARAWFIVLFQAFVMTLLVTRFAGIQCVQICVRASRRFCARKGVSDSISIPLHACMYGMRYVQTAFSMCWAHVRSALGVDGVLVCATTAQEHQRILQLLQTDATPVGVARSNPLADQGVESVPRKTPEQSSVRTKKPMPKKNDSVPADTPDALPNTGHCARSQGHAQEQRMKQGVEKNAAILQEKLACFDVSGSVTAMHIGPVVTLFEYQPTITTKVSKILSLEDDLALALRAESIRIIAPVPGKSVVGFEVAHAHRVPVLIGDIFASAAYKKHGGDLPLVLGCDTRGEHVVGDLARMPHLLVAGGTGSGKSVGLHSMLCGLLAARSAHQLRLVLVDPKRLEFARYHDIPHLLFPVVTDPRAVAPVLKWVVTEMEERYEKMARSGARAMNDYNERVPHEERMQWIVVVIDELADLMMVAGKAVEELIARIAQMARAAGIHMIVATQRPSVDVVTGMIKVNFPSRIAFRVTARVDSRTILDTGGADKLLGKGDMLFLDGGTGILKRVHGSYITDTEINGIIDQIKQHGSPQYIELSTAAFDGTTTEADDPLYDRVESYVCTVKETSVSSIQRVFKVGYNRAARIMDLLEKYGVVSGADTGKMRRVLKRRS